MAYEYFRSYSSASNGGPYRATNSKAYSWANRSSFSETNCNAYSWTDRNTYI